MKTIYKTMVIAILCTASDFSFSDNNVFNTPTKNSLVQNSEINTTRIESANDWDLTEIEWNQYLKLMTGPSGRYYEKLSPPEVLGIHATTPEEIRHFAEVAAKQEHDKLERELRFNAAFHEAAARLYTAEQIIKPFDILPFTPIPKIQE